jgi:hypothetical protein
MISRANAIGITYAAPMDASESDLIGRFDEFFGEWEALNDEIENMVFESIIERAPTENELRAIRDALFASVIVGTWSGTREAARRLVLVMAPNIEVRR